MSNPTVSNALCAVSVLNLSLFAFSPRTFAASDQDRGSPVTQAEEQRLPDSVAVALQELILDGILKELDVRAGAAAPQPKPQQLEDGPVVEPKSYTFVRISDGNLLAIRPGPDGSVIFSKTASGYAERGIKLKIAGNGASIDFPDAGVYVRISDLQALAYFDHDAEKILEVVRDNFRRRITSLEPAFVEKALKPLMPIGSGEKTSASIINEVDAKLLALGIKIPPTELGTRPTGLLGESLSYPVYLKVHGSELVLLRIVQRGEEIEFSKNATGYAAIGAEVSLAAPVVPAASVDFGLEIPTAELFFPLEIEQALALVDGDIEKILKTARAQASAINYSVDPELLERVLSRFEQTAPRKPAHSASSNPVPTPRPK
jgi:hypothetical protein